MGHGGKRTGAGRPANLNRYGESTIPMRIPASRINEIKQYLMQTPPQSRLIPLFSSSVRAGSPLIVDDSVEEYVDLNTLLSEAPGSTFLVRAAGDSMIDTPIFEGDMLVVERTDSPAFGKIVIAALDGEVTVKRLLIDGQQIILMPENKDYSPIIINEEHTLKILGLVTHIIHKTQ